LDFARATAPEIEAMARRSTDSALALVNDRDATHTSDRAIRKNEIRVSSSNWRTIIHLSTLRFTLKLTQLGIDRVRLETQSKLERAKNQEKCAQQGTHNRPKKEKGIIANLTIMGTMLVAVISAVISIALKVFGILD